MEVSAALATAICVYFAFVVVRFILSRQKQLQLLRKGGIPGPPPHFFSGHMPELRAGQTPDVIIKEWLDEYGNVFGYYVGGLPHVVINDLEILKQILVKDFHIFSNRPPMFLDVRPLNKTLLALRDHRWKEVRSVLTPTFSSGKIKIMTQIVAKKVDMTVSVVSEHAEQGRAFDIYELLQGLTLDVISSCALAMKTHCQERTDDPFLVAVRDFFRYANNKAVELAIMLPFVANIMTFISNYLTAGQMTSMIVDNVQKAIKARRAHRDVKSIDILQLMLDSEGGSKEHSMTDEEIVANAYIFLLAGYETTATALAFTFYLLITHPHIQERLYQEIKDVEDVNYNSIHGIPYLEQVLSESLRLFPPVTGFVTRQCSQDYPVGQYTIPKGAVVLAPVWEIHHNPEYWPDPWTFDPDRFSPERKASINSMAYLSFGAGRRNCIGARFAQLEAKLAIFRLVKRFRFEMCEQTDHPVTLVCPTVIINPSKGVYLRAVRREAQL